jgi:hypothetical protein
MLFAFPVAIAVPITGGFLLGGPALGFLAAVLVAIVIVVAAIRMEPRAWRRSAARGQPGAPVEPAPDGTEVVYRANGRTAERPRRHQPRRPLSPTGPPHVQTEPEPPTHRSPLDRPGTDGQPPDALPSRCTNRAA